MCVGAHGRVATIWSDRDGRNGESHHKLRSVPLKLKVRELEKEKLRACVYMCVFVYACRVHMSEFPYLRVCVCDSYRTSSTMTCNFASNMSTCACVHVWVRRAVSSHNCPCV